MSLFLYTYRAGRWAAWSSIFSESVSTGSSSDVVRFMGNFLILGLSTHHQLDSELYVLYEGASFQPKQLPGQQNIDDLERACIS